MAKIVGTSGAWKSICLELNRVNIHPEKPSEIFTLLEDTKKEYALAKVAATQEVQNQIESLKKDVAQLETNFSDEIQRHNGGISAQIQVIQLSINLLQDGAGVFRRIFNYSKIRKYKDEIRILKAKNSNYPQMLRKKTDEMRKTLEGIQKNFDLLVEGKCQSSSYKVMSLEAALKSPELAGGIAELELIESLRTLPDNYHVISDVKLEIDKPVHFDGDWLKSAQIDHVVVAPSGIFVVEVKNWSKRFSEEGSYFDPYQQIKRSSYLCYKLIGESLNLKVRNIIAYKGSIPEKPPDSHVKVLPIKEVKGYILWFKELHASNQVAEESANWFAGKSST